MAQDGELDFGSSEGPPPVVISSKMTLWEQGVNIGLRVIFALGLVAMFFVINVQVWRLISSAFQSDATLLAAKTITGEQRLVTDKVLMALIGATAVEVGVGIAAIIAYLFPGTRRKPD